MQRPRVAHRRRCSTRAASAVGAPPTGRHLFTPHYPPTHPFVPVDSVFILDYSSEVEVADCVNCQIFIGKCRPLLAGPSAEGCMGWWRCLVALPGGAAWRSSG